MKDHKALWKQNLYMTANTMPKYYTRTKWPELQIMRKETHNVHDQ